MEIEKILIDKTEEAIMEISGISLKKKVDCCWRIKIEKSKDSLYYLLKLRNHQINKWDTKIRKKET